MSSIIRQNKTWNMSQASSQIHLYPLTVVCQFVLNSVCMDFAELPDVKRISSVLLMNHTHPIAQYCLSISPATPAALFSYLPSSTAVIFFLVWITKSLLTICISFTLFPRQWRRLFANPQVVLHRKPACFLHRLDDSQPVASDTSFLHLLCSL